MFELICNVGLFVFLVFSYFTHVIEAKIPKSYLKNPNVIHPSAWPKAIIILLLICIAVNIYKIIKKNKGNPDFTFSKFCKNSAEFFKSKMFLGMIILAAAAMLLELLGFVVTAALTVVVMILSAVFQNAENGFLVGHPPIYVGVCLLALIAATVLFLRETVSREIPFLRSFALFLENLF